MTAHERRFLLLTSHPDSESLTVSVSQTIASGIASLGCVVDIVNLSHIGFDPVFGPADLAAYRSHLVGEVPDLPADVRHQQELIANADALILVFPVYWWSLPAHLKGWADRVLTGGWAWGNGSVGPNSAGLSQLTVHVVALAGTDQGHYQRHAYTESIQTQIYHGIVDYVSARRGVWTWLWDAAESPHESLSKAADAALEITNFSAAPTFRPPGLPVVDEATPRLDPDENGSETTPT